MSSSSEKAAPPCTRSSSKDPLVYTKRKRETVAKEAAVDKMSQKAKPTTPVKKKPSKKETAPCKDVVLAAVEKEAAVEKTPKKAKLSQPSKKAIVVKKKETVPRVKKAPLAVAAATADKPRDDGGSKFASTCRPQTLAELATNLCKAQKESLKEIGFDSLLKIKIDTLPAQMLGWLVKHFNGTSRMLKINESKAFVITPADIRDVLLLPMHGGQRVQVFKKSDNIAAITELKNRCGIAECVSVKELKQLLLSEAYQEGGDDFKRLYVLLSLSSFLAPTANCLVDFSPLKALLDVDAIPRLDWCSFVLDRLCKVVNKFNRGAVKKVSGCVLALQVIYLHRMKWKGRAEPHALPLIQHWTTESMRERIREESEAGEYGQGEWVADIYPVSRDEPTKKDDLDLLVDAIVQEVACEDVSSPKGGGGDDVYIKFRLPPGAPTDAEIERESADPVQETFLLLKRDMSVVSEHYMERLKKMKDKVPPPPPTGAVHKQPPVSILYLDERASVIEEYLKASDKFWDENVVRILDESVAKSIFMKKLAEKGPTFDLLPPELRSPECTPPTVDVDILTGGLDAARKSASAHKKNRPCDESIYGPLLCEVCTAAEKTGFLSSFMTGNKRLLVDMDARDKQVLDFCFFDAHTFYDTTELLFHKDPLSISRTGMLTLNTRRWVCSSVIDIWAWLLNKDQDCGRRLFLNTAHSYYVQKIFKKVGVVEDHEEAMRKCWESYVEESGKDLNSADLICVPIFWESHYFCAVVNFIAGKIQFLDNRNESDAMEYISIINLVHTQLSILLEGKNHPKGKLVRGYEVEFVALPWQSSDEVNDCGVLLMHHMEHFKGEPYVSDDDLSKAMVRRVLRAKICLRVVLSDHNELRSDILKKTHDFCLTKGELKKKIEEKKKSDAAAERLKKKKKTKKN